MRRQLLRLVPAAVTGLVVLAGLQVIGSPAARTPAPAPAIGLPDLQLIANNPSLNIFVDFQSPSGGTPPITGDSTGAHPGLVDATSVHFVGENPTTLGSASGGAGTGKAKFEELELRKGLDKASTPLFMASMTGGHYGKVVITLDKTGVTGPAAIAMRITLGTVFVNKIDIGVGPEYGETVNLAFGSARLEFFGAGSTPTKPTTNQAWNVIANQPPTDI